MNHFIKHVATDIPSRSSARRNARVAVVLRDIVHGVIPPEVIAQATVHASAEGETPLEVPPSTPSPAPPTPTQAIFV